MLTHSSLHSSCKSWSSRSYLELLHDLVSPLIKSVYPYLLPKIPFFLVSLASCYFKRICSSCLLLFFHLIEIDIYSGLILSQLKLNKQPLHIFTCQSQSAVILYYKTGTFDCFIPNGPTFKRISSYSFSKDERKLIITHMTCDPKHAQLLLCFAGLNRAMRL